MKIRKILHFEMKFSKIIWRVKTLSIDEILKIMVRTLVDDFFGLLTSQKIVTFASFFKTKCHFDASLTFSFFSVFTKA